MRQGYRIFPVNPLVESALGEKSYPGLRELPVQPDVVNVFRLPKFIPDIVDEMLDLGLKDLWVQLGIVNMAAPVCSPAIGSCSGPSPRKFPVLIHSFFRNSKVSGAFALRKIKKMPRSLPSSSMTFSGSGGP